MKKVSQYKVEKWLLLILFLFFILSTVTIRSAQYLIGDNSLFFKQILWYILGFVVIYFVMFIGNKFIFKNIWIFYTIGIILLIALLFFAPTINNAKCWFVIPGIGTFQPSEFMKIILIITIGSMINQFKTDYRNPTVKEEFIFLIKVAIVVLIPSFLTFLQPDTGVVIIYLIITLVMLFISGIRYRWFIIVFSILFFLIGIVLIIYFINTNLFINIFGTSFFLRVDRLLDWSKGSGYQLENGITAIGSGGLLGMGINNTPNYFPEAQTDFIFAVFSNNFGYIGSFFLISLFIFFDIKLILLAIKNNNLTHKYIIAGIVGMLIYQQFQNIGMTFGLMPITGITLPFISYGGSSLLSYMIMVGIIFNISNENMRYTN